MSIEHTNRQSYAEGRGLWEVSAPPAPETAALGQDTATEVAVVGAGFTGLSAALHLAELGIPTVVLEASTIGAGGSGRNVGLVNAGLWLRPNDVIATLGPTYGSSLIDQLSEAPALVFAIVNRYHIECEATQVGTLHCAVGSRGYREIEERARQWRALGAPVELQGASKTRALVGGGGFLGSLLDRRAGTIQPLAYVRGLARAAISQGARIYTESPVQAISTLGSRWQLLTPRGRLSATTVIVATNAYSSHACTSLRTELTRLPYFNFATDPLPESLARSILPERHGIWDTRTVLTSLRFDVNNRLIYGSVGALRGRGLGVHREWARRSLGKLFPELRDIKMRHEWYGWIGMTMDAVPRFHQLGPNIYAISGYNGRGIAPGTTFGRMLALLAKDPETGNSLPLPLTPVVTQRWRSLREAVYELGAKIVHYGSDRG